VGSSYSTLFPWLGKCFGRSCFGVFLRDEPYICSPFWPLLGSQIRILLVPRKLFSIMGGVLFLLFRSFYLPSLLPASGVDFPGLLVFLGKNGVFLQEYFWPFRLPLLSPPSWGRLSSFRPGFKIHPIGPHSTGILIFPPPSLNWNFNPPHGIFFLLGVGARLFASTMVFNLFCHPPPIRAPPQPPNFDRKSLPSFFNCSSVKKQQEGAFRFGTVWSSFFFPNFSVRYLWVWGLVFPTERSG